MAAPQAMVVVTPVAAQVAGSTVVMRAVVSSGEAKMVAPMVADAVERSVVGVATEWARTSTRQGSTCP